MARVCAGSGPPPTLYLPSGVAAKDTPLLVQANIGSRWGNTNFAAGVITDGEQFKAVPPPMPTTTPGTRATAQGTRGTTQGIRGTTQGTRGATQGTRGTNYTGYQGYYAGYQGYCTGY